MVEMTAPNGATIMASDEAAPGLVAAGFAPVARAEEAPAPKRRAPRKAKKPKDE